jgi:uncharacterized protein YbjT (DUF2867 family)
MAEAALCHLWTLPAARCLSKEEGNMILVVGATGYVGGMIARNLLDAGHDVRVLVRPGSEYGHLVDAGAQAVEGDLKDPGSLKPAVEGIQVVVTTANSASRGGDDTVETVDRAGNRNLIDSAAAAGVEQFVFTSAQVANLESPVPLFKAKAEAEEHLKSSGMDYTILAPNAFADIWVAGVVGGPALSGAPVTLVGEGKRKHSFIVARDVAAYASAMVGHPAAMNQRFELGGPEPMSLVDCARLYSQALGREVPVQTVPIGEPVPGLPPFMSEALPAFEFFDSPVPMEEVSMTFGVTMTPIEAFIRDSTRS